MLELRGMCSVRMLLNFTASITVRSPNAASVPSCRSLITISGGEREKILLVLGEKNNFTDRK